MPIKCTLLFRNFPDMVDITAINFLSSITKNYSINDGATTSAGGPQINEENDIKPSPKGMTISSKDQSQFKFKS